MIETMLSMRVNLLSDPRTTVMRAIFAVPELIAFDVKGGSISNVSMKQANIVIVSYSTVPLTCGATAGWWPPFPP